jgi:hypothetical protein
MSLPSGFRSIPDPEAEIRRLAAERAALETVAVPRHDFEVLLAVATLYLDSFSDSDTMTLPEKFAFQDVEEVVHRHGRWY